jgi:uncharacterized OsmC-like protein
MADAAPTTAPRGRIDKEHPRMTMTEPTRRNGVDVDALFGTINVVKGQPDLAQFTFRASNTWVDGTYSRTTFGTFSGAGGDHEHKATYYAGGDHPTVLTGADEAPAPVEHLLHAIASCLTAGIANVAAARDVPLRSVTSTVEGDIDLQGILGLSDDVRNGYERIRVGFRVTADAPEDKIRSIVEQSRARSAVFDIITGAVPVDIDVTVG